LRLGKLEFYNQINPKFSWNLSDEYLPELFSLDFHRAKNDGLAEFSSFFENFKPEIAAFELNETQREFIISSVKDRAREILNNRYAYELKNGKTSKHVTADEVSWIDYAPRFLRDTLAKFVSTLVVVRNKNYARTLWNYCEIYKDHKF
jgi:hypothetical protein